MKVIFDNIVFSLQRTGGISVYWDELLKRIRKDNNFQIQMLGNINDNVFGKQYNNLQRKESIIPISLLRYLSFREGIEQKTIFHSSYYRFSNSKKAINITTVHDFTYEYFITGLAKKVHCWQKYRAIQNSQAVICISENTKRDLLKFLPLAKKKVIKVIPNGVSEDYYIDNQRSVEGIIPFEKRSYILFIGSRANYKNFSLSVKTIGRSNYNFVIIGGALSDKEKKELEKSIGQNRYVVLSNISNETLNTLYNNAFCMLYPSSYEGFGIPILEAQRAGCPVIAYNASSIPEVIGETPLLLQELTIENMLEKILLLESADLRQTIVEKGLENSQKYTWNNTYKKTIELYKELWDTL